MGGFVFFVFAMQRSLVFLAFCLLASFAAAQDHDGFIGTWIDNFGQTVKLCVTEGQPRLEGSYNQFGLIQADLSDFGETANGNWYDTYYQTDDECPRGEFSWHVNGNKITGQYTCFDGLSGGVWTLDRVIPQERPSHSECFVLSDTADDDDISGAWNLDGDVLDDDDWDICIDDNQFTASYGGVGEVGSTYQFGRVFENGRILSGSYITVADNYGNIELGGSTLMLTEKPDLAPSTGLLQTLSIKFSKLLQAHNSLYQISLRSVSQAMLNVTETLSWLLVTMTMTILFLYSDLPQLVFYPSVPPSL